MSKFKKTKHATKKIPLHKLLEKELDTKDPDVEEHIAPLIHSIQNLKIEKFDLSSTDSAQQAIPMLDALINKMNTYQNTARTLKVALERKRDELEKEAH